MIYSVFAYNTLLSFIVRWSAYMMGVQPYRTGELCGMMHGLLWLLEYAVDDSADVVIYADSLYAGNELEG